MIQASLEIVARIDTLAAIIPLTTEVLAVSVTLEFESIESVPTSVQDAVKSAAKDVAPDQPWVRCEPPHFSWDEEKLYGFSKLNLMPDPAEIEKYDDPAKPHDLEALVQILCDWSKQFKINWHLQAMEESFGEIIDGHASPELTQHIQEIIDLGDLDPEGFLSWCLICPQPQQLQHPIAVTFPQIKRLLDPQVHV